MKLRIDCETAIEAEGLGKRGDELGALRESDLEAPAGFVLALVWPQWGR